MKVHESTFMRSGELLVVKFQDKKASGDKEIYVIDSRGTAGTSPVERCEKGCSFAIFSGHLGIRFLSQVE